MLAANVAPYFVLEGRAETSAADVGTAMLMVTSVDWLALNVFRFTPLRWMVSLPLPGVGIVGLFVKSL